MGVFHIILANLCRRPLRSLLIILTVATAFTLFGLLGALRSAYIGGAEFAGADRILTINKVSIVNPLPLRYQTKIEELEDVLAVTNFVYFGAYFQEPQQDFFAAATQPDRVFDVYTNWSIDPDVKKRWLETRNGVIISKGLVDRFGFQPGDNIPIGSVIFPQKGGSRTWEFTVVGVFDPGGDPGLYSSLYMRYDYFDEARAFGRGGVAWYVTRIMDDENVDKVIGQIDTMFAGSSAETKSSSESNYQKGLAKQFGNISLMVINVLAIVFVIIILIVGQTMVQSVRERTSEIAVLRTIGFSRSRIFGIIISESAFLAVLGGGIGIVLAILAAQFLRPIVVDFVPGFQIQKATILTGLLCAFLFGIITGLPPALKATRLKLADAIVKRY